MDEPSEAKAASDLEPEPAVVRRVRLALAVGFLVLFFGLAGYSVVYADLGDAPDVDGLEPSDGEAAQPVQNETIIDDPVQTDPVDAGSSHPATNETDEDDAPGPYGPRQIDECGPIEEPGSYELTRDLSNGQTDACIEIRTSDVVLEGNGHVVEGGGVDQSVGLQIFEPDSTVTNVTVRNLQVRNWFNGVQIGSSAWYVPPEAPATAELQGVTASNNDQHGLYLSAASGSRLSSITATDNGQTGIGLFNASDVQIDGATATGNDEHGLALFEGVFDGRYTGVTATDNANAGISIGRESTGNEFSDLTVRNNQGSSVEGYDGRDNAIDAPGIVDESIDDGDSSPENEDRQDRS